MKASRFSGQKRKGEEIHAGVIQGTRETLGEVSPPEEKRDRNPAPQQGLASATC